LQGANKQGIKEHLKVKKKQDALGVGAVSAHRSSITDMHVSKPVAVKLRWAAGTAISLDINVFQCQLFCSA
jgi:hypothetical protein